MKHAKYLIRIDDICEGLNIVNFYKLIDIFNKFEVKPIIAVIPFNKDKKLIFPESIYGEKFWKLIHKLEKEFKWKVGVHGYEHNYITNNGGILQINNFSEFAGLEYSEQYSKIQKAIKIMNNHNISSDLFIAPGHSFDSTTIKVLADIGIETVSDGFYSYPGKDKNGLFWIPQQLWEFKYKEKGVWTVNFHINNWKDDDFNKLIKNLEKYRSLIVDYQNIKKHYLSKKLNLFDFLKNKYEIKKNILITYLVKIKSKIRLNFI